MLESANQSSFVETWPLPELDLGNFEQSINPYADDFFPHVFTSSSDFTQTDTWNDATFFTDQFADVPPGTDIPTSTSFDSGIGSAWQPDAFAAGDPYANHVPKIQASSPSYSLITDAINVETPLNQRAGFLLEDNVYNEIQGLSGFPLDDEVGGMHAQNDVDDAEGNADGEGSEYIASPISREAGSDEDNGSSGTTFPFHPPLWESFDGDTDTPRRACVGEVETAARKNTGGKSVSYTNKLISRHESTGSKSPELLLKSSINNILVSSASAETKLALIGSLAGANIDVTTDDASYTSDTDDQSMNIAAAKHEVASPPAQTASRKSPSPAPPVSSPVSPTPSHPAPPRTRAPQMHWTPAEHAFVTSILPSIVSSGHTSEARFAIIASQLNARFGDVYRARYGEGACRTKSSVKNQVARVIRGLLPEGVDDRGRRRDGRKRKVVTSAREKKGKKKRGRWEGEGGEDGEDS